MGIIKKARDFWRLANNLDSYQRGLEILNILQNNAHGEPDFFDFAKTPGYFSNAGSVFGVTDEEVSAGDVYQMVHKDTYFPGLFEQLVEGLFEKGFYISIATDQKGKELGNRRKARMLENKLIDLGFLELMKKNVYAKVGDGGGNGLFFLAKERNKYEFKFEPFWKVGIPRVKVYADVRKQVIEKYEVIDEAQQAIYTIKPSENLYYHSRYSVGGDFRFSSNPAKRAVYWFVLKKYIAGSNLASFKKGLQDPVVGSPDYSSLTHLVNAMGQNRVSSEAKKEYLKDPIQFLARQSELDDEIIRELTGDARQSNAFLKLKMPYNFQKVGRTNKDMETIPLINLCDEQMGYALRTSRGIINTKDSKYSNAEIEKDNWSTLVLDPERRACEELARDFLLPILDPDYDPSIYRPRVGRDPDQEDLDIWKAQTERNKSIGENLQVSQTLTGWEFNPDTNKWERRDKSSQDQPPVNQDETEEDIENNEEPEERQTRKFSIDDIEAFYLYEYEEPETRETFEEKRDRVFAKYHETVNMSRSELSNWAETECSKKASLDRTPITRNLELLDTKKADWEAKHITWANKTIAFVARMKKNLGGKNIVKDSNGRECGTRAFISLKNWAFDSGKRLINLLREKPEDFLVSGVNKSDFKKFKSLVQKSLEKQVKNYTEKLEKRDNLQEALNNVNSDLASITSQGLPLTTLKEQILKPAKTGVQEFNKTDGKREEFTFPPEILQLIDSKSQLLTKGYSSLNADQRILIDTYFGNYQDYDGLDGTTSKRINDILVEALNTPPDEAGNVPGVKGATERILQKLPELSEERAARIAVTETNQAYAATRDLLYKNAGYDEHKWNSVKDSRVRTLHRANDRQGWIPINETFASGENSPAEAIRCRCVKSYRRSELS